MGERTGAPITMPPFPLTPTLSPSAGERGNRSTAVDSFGSSPVARVRTGVMNGGTDKKHSHAGATESGSLPASTWFTNHLPGVLNRISGKSPQIKGLDLLTSRTGIIPGSFALNDYVKKPSTTSAIDHHAHGELERKRVGLVI